MGREAMACTNTHKRRDFLYTLAGATAAAQFPLAAQAAAKDSRPPNIVLIMADDLGYECLGCNGGTSYATPNLDALAAGGVRFTHGFSTPKCGPSRVCIMTGRYSFRNYIGWGSIPKDEITFGHMLQRAGYKTALAGKWQMALLKENPDHVREMGFQQSSCWAWHEGPRYFDPMIWQNGKIREGISDRYGPDVYCEFLQDFIRENKNSPFLAYFPMTLPHYAKTGGAYKEPKGPNGEYQTYKEMVEQMDRVVGNLVKTLDEEGLRENTLILFTGDNGSPQNVKSKWKGQTVQGGKAKLSDNGIHVPLIANWQGAAPAGTVCHDLVDFSDFFPTFAEAAGIAPPKGVTIDGRSFLPQIMGKTGQPHDWIYTEWQGKSIIRTKKWKWYDNGTLYNMLDDPKEQNPIPPGEQETVRKRLMGIMKDLKDRS
ncbi:sulfatase-like hydrolase/transferase [bacterium]|nr:sulfatase-like hydrolase/transferase [bacterium]